MNSFQRDGGQMVFVTASSCHLAVRGSRVAANMFSSNINFKPPVGGAVRPRGRVPAQACLRDINNAVPAVQVRSKRPGILLMRAGWYLHVKIKRNRHPGFAAASWCCLVPQPRREDHNVPPLRLHLQLSFLKRGTRITARVLRQQSAKHE